jgi:hypothetical protein
VLCATWFLLALLSGRRWIRGDEVTLTAGLSGSTENARFPVQSSFGSAQDDPEPGSASSGGISKWAALTIVLWGAALATKETAAMFPFVLAAYDWLAVRRPGDDLYHRGHRDHRDTPSRWARWSAGEKRRRMLTMYLPLVAVTLVAGVARLAVLARVEYSGQVKVHWLYILVELDVIRRYVWLLLNPSGQALFHEVSAIGSAIDLRALVAVASVGAIVAVGWMVRRVEWLASFGLFWFLLLLVPSSALIVLDQGEPMSEHRVYLASCGFFLAAGAGIDWLRARMVRASPLTRRLAAGALALVLLSFAGETLLRNVVWASPVTLWRESVDMAPGHFRPRLLLGEALEDAGRRDEAIEQYQTAIRLRPAEPTGYVKLARCLADAGRLDEATATFRRLQTLDPRSVAASNGLAVVAMMSGRPDRAREHFLETIAIDPRNVSARQSLAALEEKTLANPAEALRLCEEIERLAPGTPGNEDCIRRNRSRPATPF